MNYFRTNIKVLRKRKKRTQDDVAHEFDIPRATLNSLENGSIENPKIEMLIKCSDYFKVTIDVLIKEDLSTYSEYQFYQLNLSTPRR